jgi:uncharacterized protein (TIGR02145 family)
MINYLGGKEVAGGKLKEKGLSHWYNENSGANNETGFTALPAGYRTWYGEFGGLGYNTSWWTSTPSYGNSAWIVGISGSTRISTVTSTAGAGYSIRCIKDK